MLRSGSVNAATTSTIFIHGDNPRIIPATGDRDPPALCYSACTQTKAYPSPPMSRPASPGEHFSEASAPAITSGAVSSAPLTVARSQSLATTSTHVHGPVLQLETQYPYVSVAPIGSSVESAPPTSTTSLQPRPLLAISTQQQAGGAPLFTRSIGFATSSAEAGPSTRPVRRAKAHVASACINCKRAHLSCDVQRPCRRCVDSGKEDTCHDVQHKKRGRPRLREEPEAGPSTARQQQSTSVQQTQTRPIASTRSRRADSYRSHRSHGSESSGYDPRTPRSATTYPTFLTTPFPGPSSALPGPEVPTAFLDLDLMILRANRSFQQAVAILRDLTHTRLGDIVTPVDGASLSDIRNRLRGEREQREPSYLPPIVQTGQDPLANVQDADVDRFTQGNADNTYTWIATTDSTQTPLTARVRLAKLTTYFVVVTFPPLQQQQRIAPLQYQPQIPHDPQMIPSSGSVPRPIAGYTAPLQYPYPTPGPAQPPRYDLRGIAPPTAVYPPQRDITQTYQPTMTLSEHPQPPQDTALIPAFVPPGYQPQLPAHMARMAVSTPTVAPGDVVSSQFSSATQDEGQGAARESSGEEAAEGSQSRGTKRQRRMGISEVLQ